MISHRISARALNMKNFYMFIFVENHINHGAKKINKNKKN